MKLEINEEGVIQLEEVYNSIVLKTENETFSICMRDGGFEFKYNGQWYYALNGSIVKLDHNNVNF